VHGSKPSADGAVSTVGRPSSVRSEEEPEEEETVPIALNGYFRMIREKRVFSDNCDALACENG
jgi:hypothetical protein